MASLASLLQAAWKEYESDHARYFAVAMVYYALMSLVPLVLLLLSVLGLLLRLSDVVIAVEQQVLNTVETSFGAELRHAIEQLLFRIELQSATGTLVSLGGLLLTASLLFRHLRMTFRAMWRHTPPLVSGSVLHVVRLTLRERTIAFMMVLMGGALLLGALALIAVVQWLGGRFGNRLPVTNWLVAGSSSLVLVPLTFALLFKFLPPVRLRWRHVGLAVALCSIAWLIGVEIVVLYGAFFTTNLSTYGALGGVLVVMLWMNAISQVLFYGAELCKVVAAQDQDGFEMVAGSESDAAPGQI